MRRSSGCWRLAFVTKGIVFTIDAVIALLFVGLLGGVLFINNFDATKDIEKILINNQISDVLLSAQLLEIENINELESIFLKLFKTREGFITFNTQKKDVNKKGLKTKVISQNIKYINASNKEIYIEVGVYY